MTQEQIVELYSNCEKISQIITENNPIQPNNTFIVEGVKNVFNELFKELFTEDEISCLNDWLNKTDFWTAPASSRFHGDFKCGLSLHTFKVVQQSFIFAKAVLENYFTSPEAQKITFTITAKDIFIAAFAHDFCKTGFYSVEYRNTKDFTGNWIKQPFYKTRSDNRNLGHGNESVLMLLEIFPEYIQKRYVLEAISRHMGFSDLSDSESYNYSNFLQNPLVILLQLADQTAAQWFGC